MKLAATTLLLMLASIPPLAAADSTAPAILSPVQGAIVSSPVTIKIAPGSSAAAMPGMDMPGMTMSGGTMSGGTMSSGAHGHLHLIIDAPLPGPGTRIPMDKQHLHLMHGETSKTIALPPGQHTVQLIAGTAGHKVPANAEHSDAVIFEVK